MVRQLFGSRWLTRRSSTRHRRRESTIARRGTPLGSLAYAGASFEPLEGRALLAALPGGGATEYVENFDDISSALPTGWTVRTGATSASLGTVQSFTTTATAWSDSGGRFKNFASADGGTATDDTATQSARADRALGIRQTGSFGDPGAAFVFEVDDTLGRSGFALEFSHQMLSVQTRSSSWNVQYSTNGGSEWTTVGTYSDPGVFGSTPVSYNFGAGLNDVANPVFIRITTLAASTGTGSRDSYAIDDFRLTWSNSTNVPGITTSGAGNFVPFTTIAGTVSPAQTFTVSGTNLTEGILVTPPAGLEVSLDGTTYAPTVTIPETSGLASGTVHVRVATTASVGAFSGTVTLSSAGATNASIAVSGSVRPTQVALPYGPAAFSSDGEPWFAYSVAGSKDWTYLPGSTLGDGGTSASPNGTWEINGFQSDQPANDWLMIGPFDFSSVTNPIMSFNTLAAFTSTLTNLDELKLKASFDFTGTGNPTSATWTDYTFAKPTVERTKTASGDILLAGMEGKSAVYVAFHYDDAATQANPALWQIDDVEIANVLTPIVTVAGGATPFSTIAGTVSAAQTFSFNGANLTEGILVTPPAGVEVSLDGTNYASTVTIPEISGSASGTLHLRVAASASVGAFSGNVTLSTAGATSVTIAVSGSVRPTQVALPYGPAAFTTDGEPWFSYSVAGSKNWTYLPGSTLGDGGTSASPNGTWEMNGYGSDQAADDWLMIGPFDFSSVTNPIMTFNTLNRYTAGQTIVDELKLKTSTNYSGSGAPSGATWTEHTFTKPTVELTKTASGDVLLSGTTGQSAVYVAFHYVGAGTTNGTTAVWQIDDVEIENVLTPTILGGGTATPFSTIAGTASAVQTFSFNGANLTEGILVTPPAGVEVSLDGGTYASTVTIPQSSGSANGTVHVRVAASASVGAFSGTVTLSSAGATNASIAVNGSVRPTQVALPYGLADFSSDGEPWFSYSVAGTKNWTYLPGSTLGGGGSSATPNGTWEINGFQSDQPANDWLMIGPFDMSAAVNPFISFNSLAAFTSSLANLDELKLKASTDYAGSGDPTSATWTEFTFAKPTAERTKTASGDVRLTGMAGQSAVYLAFHYDDTVSATGTALWQIDDVTVFDVVPTTLAAGDIAILGYDLDGAPDSVTILVLKDLEPTTTFFLTDKSVASDGGTDLGTGEGVGQLTVKMGQAIPAGTVLKLNWDANTSSTTAYDWIGPGSGLGRSGEELYIYTATDISSTTPTAFIYGANLNGGTGARPDGLTTGTTFVTLSGERARYETAGATYRGSQATLLAAIADTANNWETVAPVAAGDWTFAVGDLVGTSTTLVGVTPTTVNDGDQITFTGTVTAAAGADLPVGTIEIRDGATLLASTSTITGSGANGNFSIVTTTVPPGTYAALKAVFVGAANDLFTDSESGIFGTTLTVNQLGATALPTVITPTSTAPTATTVTLGGTVTDAGGGTITERGIVYSLTSDDADPQIGESNVTRIAASTSGIGTFTIDITGLTASSGYTFRAYATNSLGTSYSPVATFATNAQPTTLAAGDIAIIGYHNSGNFNVDATNYDYFSILVLTNLTAGTTFFVSDNEVATADGTAFTDINECEAVFTVKPGQTIPAGTVITLPWGPSAYSTSNFDWSAPGGGLSSSGDTLYVYTATNVADLTPTAFIYGMKVNGSEGERPAGLVNGTTFISTTATPASRYKTSGATYSGTRENLLAAIGNVAANWEATAPAQVPDWTFTVTGAAIGTTTTLGSVTPLSVTAGDPVTFSGTVVAASGSGQPTGTVEIRDGATVLASTSALAGTGPNATFQIVSSNVPAGTYSALKAVFVASGAYETSESAVFGSSLVVTPPVNRSALTVATAPSGHTYGDTFGLVVEARTSGNQLDTGFIGNVTLAINSGSGTLAGTTTVAAVGGVATFSGLSLSAAGSFAFDITADGLTATTSTVVVTPKQLTLTGATANDKVYDGTTTGTLTGGSLTGIVGQDVVTAVGTFASADVANGISVTAQLDGADALNYTLAPVAGLTANITPRPITVTGISIAPKVIDGTTTARIVGTAALDALVGGDAVTLDASGAAAVFGNASVGTGKSVTISGYAISGADIGNYAFTQPTGISGDILAPAFTRWTFETQTLEPFFGAGSATNMGTTTTWAGGNGGGFGWNTSSYASQGEASGQRGVEFRVSTAGRSDISFSFDHRASGTASRWAQVDYTLDGGQTWVTNHWRNGGGLSPHDRFATYTVDFSGVSGAPNNPDFGVRIVSIFSPLAFDQSSTLDPFAADSAYMRANANAVYSPNTSTATGDYGASGSWRFDNVTFRGVPGGPLVNAASATETLRIVTYNIASSGDNGLPRTGLDTVLQAIGTETVGGYSGAIELLALQEVQSQAVTSAAVVSSLNAIYGADTYAHGAVDGASTGSGTVGVVYDTASLTLLNETAITTGGPRQAMRYLFRPTAATGAESFYVYVAHFKSTADAASEATRAAEAAAIRADADTLGPGVSILYLGDFNLYSSNEAAYQTLIGAGNGQAFDPINQLGSWSNDASFTGIHTQAPKNMAPSGLVGGGLDDRFDFQLVSAAVNGTGLGLRYVPGSYRAFGNNGSVGLNGDIDDVSNTALAGLANRSTVLGLLGTVSDHLPVVADYVVPVAAAIGSMTTTYGTASAAQSFVVSATELTGNLSVAAPTGFELATTEFGTYGTSAITLTPTNGVVSTTLFVRLAGTAAGTFSGNITITGGGAATETLAIGTSTVNKAVLTVSGTPTVADREYDGTTTATVSLNSAALTGIIGGDDVSLSTTGAFTSANAANGITVTLVLAGTARDNYDLVDPGITGNITRKALTITAASIADREYDGTVTAGTLTIGTLSGFVGSETVTAAGAAADYASANAGTYNSVAVTYTLADGDNGGLAANYTLVAGSAAGLVTTRAITITADATSKTYGDAEPALSFSYVTARLITGDSFTGTLSRATGEDVANSPYAITQGTLSLGANYTITFVGANFTITPKALTIIGLSAQDKTYDGTTGVTVSGTPAYDGLVNGDSFAISGAVTWAFTDANAGTAKPIVGTGSYAAPSANYSVVQPALTANISTRAITITADAASKTYGDTEPGLSYQITSGSLADGDVLTGALTRVAGENVGTYAISQGSLDAGANYTISFTGANLSITTKGLIVTADTRTKVYGAVDPTLTYVTSGLVGSDALTGALTRVAGENVGTYAISQGSLSAGSNYTISFTGADLVVTPKALTITGLSAANKIYDGTVSAPVSGTPAYSGLMNGESFAVTGAVTWAFADANVGTAKPISRIGSFAAPSANYTLTQPTGLTADITPKALTISGLSAANKVYDGTVSAPVSGTPAYSGLVNGENFAVSGAVTWAFADANVGIAKPISRIGNFAAPSVNYTLTQPTGLAADITPKALAITGLSAADKVYDGTTAAGVSGTPAYDGLVNGESFAVSGAVTWAFADANVGTAKPISRVGNFAAPSANYTLTQPTGLAADITPRPLTVAGAAAVDKVYDGTTAATISGATLVGVVAGDALTVSGTGTFDSPNAATGIAVTPALALSGTAAPNYTLTQPTGLTAAITPRPVTVRAGDVTKNTGESLTGGPGSTAFDASGLLAGDTIGSVTIAYGAAAAAGTLGGRYAGQVVPSAATGGTFNPANYALTYTPGDIVVFTVNQPPAAVTLTNVVASLPENTASPSALKLADIVVTDDGLGTNGLSLTGPDADAFTIVDGALFLRAGIALDFEAKAAYDVTIVVVDPEHTSQPLAVPYRLSVTDVNETPTALSLSATTIPENAPAGTVIGAFSSTDPDTGDSFTYTLVPGDGDADNASFTITGGQLASTVPFNFEMQPTLSVRVRSTDAAGAFIERVFTINVTDVDEPLLIEGMQPPAASIYRLGDTLRFTVVLTRPVTVSGRPQLQFGLGRNASVALFGGGRRTATYAEGSGTNRLSFDYRVTRRDDAAQVFYRGAIAGTRTQIRDADGNVLDGRLPMANEVVEGVRIDTVAPRAVGRIGLPSRGSYRAGDTLTFRVNFSEDVLVTGTPELTVRIGRNARQATYAAGSGTRELSFDYVIAADDATIGRRGISADRAIRLLNGATIADAAGNAASVRLTGPFAAAVTIDGSAATPSRARLRASAFASLGR